jgi:sterol desaturase/sphingolipid hydroxylase (fatty acid hydroxylase superfamily)
MTTAQTMTALAPVVVTLGALCLTVAIGLHAAIPPGHRRKVRPAALVRALLPRRLLRSASGRADIAWMIFGTLLAGGAIGWALVSSDHVTTWASHRLVAMLGTPAPLAIPGWLASTIMTLAIFLAYEFAYWLNHWLSHRVPALWAFHKVHHGADSLSPLTNFRVHPVDTILFYNMAAVLMGLTAAGVNHALGQQVPMFEIRGSNLLIHLNTITLSYLQHTHLWLRFGPRGGRILLGPAHHQIHHSTDPAHFNRNLGGALAIWDRMFGTFHMPGGKRARLAFGVEGMRDPHGIAGGVLFPFAEAMETLAPARRTDAAAKDSALTINGAA